MDTPEAPSAIRGDGALQLVSSIVLVSVAQVALKLAMAGGAAAGLLAWPLQPAAWMGWLAVGVACYAVSMLAWVGALARLPVSLAYPSLSLSFIAVFFAAVWVPALHETLDLQRLAGILLLVAGNVTVALSDQRTHAFLSRVFASRLRQHRPQR